MERLVARIGKPHGLRGEVTVRVHTDDPERRFAPGAVLRTQAEAGSGVPRSLTVRAARPHQAAWLVSFVEVPDRTGAESLRGTRLVVDAAAGESGDDTDTDLDAGAAGAASTDGPAADVARATDVADEDAWYESELVGLVAVDPAGQRFGEIVGLAVGGAQDLLEIALDDGGRALVPFVRALVPEVDVAGGRVVVDAPPGLLELGTA